jgi:acyl carrier protein
VLGAHTHRPILAHEPSGRRCAPHPSFISSPVTHMSEDRLKRIVAESLRIPVDRVSESLEFSTVPEWDSLGHVSLMLALEGEYGVSIPDDLVLELTTYGAIRDFILQQSAAAGGS